jgi:hypothetical protein
MSRDDARLADGPPICDPCWMGGEGALVVCDRVRGSSQAPACYDHHEQAGCREGPYRRMTQDTAVPPTRPIRARDSRAMNLM